MPRLLTAKVILTVLILLALDLCFAPFFGVFRPVFCYHLVLYGIFSADWKKAVGLAFLTGFLRDAVSIQPLGVEIFVLFSMTFILGFVVQKIERESWPTRLGLSFLFAFFVSFLNMFLTSFLNANSLPPYLIWISFCSALATALTAPVFFQIARIWFGERAFLKQYELFR